MRFYRGQKQWWLGMPITAPSIRYGYGPDVVTFTEHQVHSLNGMLAAADAGDTKARDALENKLLYIQLAKQENPFVSCSRMWSVAQGFATHGDTPGFVLTIEGEIGSGFDFAAVRERHAMFADGFDHLHEFGIPVELGATFDLVEVHHVQSFGRPSKRVHP